MDNQNFVQGVPPQGSPVINPATNQYLEATAGSPPVADPTHQATLDEILQAVRGGQRIPERQDAPPAPAPQPEQQNITSDLTPNDVRTGNDVLDTAVYAFVQATGTTKADLDQAISSAMEYGDPRLIDQTFLRQRFGQNAEQAIKLAQAVVSHIAESTNQMVANVHSKAGGKPQWDAAVAMFKQTAPAGLVEAARRMLDSGDRNTAEQAADMIVGYVQQAGIRPDNNQLRGSSGLFSQGLSAGEFQQAVHKLNPNSRTYNSDYSRLMEMRKIGKQMGK